MTEVATQEQQEADRGGGRDRDYDIVINGEPFTVE